MSERKELKCTKKPVPGPWDTIVIGSGISGLCVAAELSRKGRRVLVLEQHFQPGGFTHVFNRSRFEWDVGIHYLGNGDPSLERGADWFMHLSAITSGAIEFERFPDPIDLIRYPDLQVEMPTGYEAYTEELGRHFPAEKDGIASYLARVAETRRGLRNFFATGLLSGSLRDLLRRLLMGRMREAALSTTDEIMSGHISDERLKDVLDAQWGNIGMPRSKCSFLIHAAMLGCFLESGGYYPRGGCSVFARELGDVIHRNGSAIRVDASVDRIVVENGRAVGVRLGDGEEIRAERVVSSAGAHKTFNSFLKGEELVAAQRSEINGVPLNYEYMNLFMGFDTNPREFGLGTENHWIYESWGSEPKDGFWDIRDLERHPRPHIMFLNSSSLRNPEHGKNGNDGHVGQVVFIGKQGVFDQWEDSRWRKRGEDYEQLKERAGRAVIEALDRRLPGLGSHVTRFEVGTPLSYRTFSGHPRGIPYGIASIPDRYRLRSLRPQTPIKKLYLTGQDLVLPGIPAAVGSAMMTLSAIQRRNAGGGLVKEARALFGI
jgi:all-trans-retinol 13,14-reductase